MKLRTIDDLQGLKKEHVGALINSYSFIKELKTWIKKHRNRRSSLDAVKVVNCRECEGTGKKTLTPRSTLVAHPSSFGPDACLRRIWYDLTGELEEISNFTPELLLIFDIGHAGHAMLQNYCHGMYGDKFQEEVPSTIDDLLVYGSMDGLIDLGHMRMAMEIKTASNRSYTDITRKGVPKTDHLWQISAYMMANDLPLALFVYFNKDNSAMTEFLVPFPEYIWAKVEDMLTRVIESDDDGPGPEKPDGSEISPYRCKDCVYNHGCDKKLGRKR